MALHSTNMTVILVFAVCITTPHLQGQTKARHSNMHCLTHFMVTNTLIGHVFICYICVPLDVQIACAFTKIRILH